MKRCLFLILLVMTPWFALAKATEAYLGKAAPMYAPAEPTFRVRQHDNTSPPKRRVTSAAVKAQPMIIKLKPHKNYTAVRRITNRPTMAMRPIYPPRRVVASVPMTSPNRRNVTATSTRYPAKQQTPTTKTSKQNTQMRRETNKSTKQKLAKADS